MTAGFKKVSGDCPGLYRRNDVYYAKFTKDGKRIERTLKTRNLERAKELLFELKMSKPNKGTVTSGMNIEGIVEKYWRHQEKYRTPATNSSERKHLQSFIDSAGIKFLRDIDKDKIKEFLNKQMDERGVSAVTANHYRISLSAFLTWCEVEEDLIESNPCRKITPQPVGENIIRYLEPEQFADMMTGLEALRAEASQVENEKTVIQQKKFQTLWAIAGVCRYMGLRRSEALWLSWNDVTGLDSPSPQAYLDGTGAPPPS